VRELHDKVKMSIDDVQYLQQKIKRRDADGDTVRYPTALTSTGGWWGGEPVGMRVSA